MKGASILMSLLVACGTAAPSALRSGFSVVSLNLARETDSRKILRDLGGSARVRAGDVFLLQEAAHSDHVRNGVAGELAKALNMHVTFAPAGPGVYDLGLAILSRYPIRDSRVLPLKRCNLRVRSRSRFALGATIDAPGGPVRVWNVHLDTRINTDERLAQLAPVLDQAAAFAGPVIIGGDFNTNNFYWIGNLVPVPGLESHTDALRRFMKARGFTAPSQPARPTFDYLGLQLDWIYQKQLDPGAAAVQPMRFSDHHALVVEFGRVLRTSFAAAAR